MPSACIFSPFVFTGEGFSFRFETAGSYKVYCQHHSMAGMNATVTVT